MNLAIGVLVWVLGGFGLRRGGLVRAETAAELTQLVFWLTLPPLIFTSVHAAHPAGADLAMPLLAWGMSGLAMGLGLVVARALKLPAGQAGAFVLALAYGNTTFLGYPLIGGLYPAPAPHLTLAILFDQLGTTFAVNTLGAALAARSAGQRSTLGQLLGKLLRFPPLWALALGVLTRPWPLPPALEGLLLTMGALTVPLMLVCLGLSVRLEAWREGRWLVLAIAVVKLLLMPAAVWAVVSVLGLPAPHRATAVLEAAMPTMFYAMTLALGFGLDAVLVINAIVFTTALSALTIPMWHCLVP